AGRLQVRYGGAVPGPLVGQHRHRNAPGQRDGLGVGGPVRGRQQHLVAGIEQGRECLVHGLLAAVGDQDLARRDLVPRVTGRLGGDRLPQLGQPGGGGVLVEPGLGAGPLGRRYDVVRGGEVRFSRAEADYRPARRLERFGLGGHGERRRFGDGADTFGNAAVGGSHEAILSSRGGEEGLPAADGFDGSAPGNYTSRIGGGSVNGPRAPAWADGA